MRLSWILADNFCKSRKGELYGPEEHNAVTVFKKYMDIAKGENCLVIKNRCFHSTLITEENFRYLC